MKVDMVVMRHPNPGAGVFLSQHVDASIINAGDGAHEHPTQALLDSYFKTVERIDTEVEKFDFFLIDTSSSSNLPSNNFSKSSVLSAFCTSSSTFSIVIVSSSSPQKLSIFTFAGFRSLGTLGAL